MSKTITIDSIKVLGGQGKVCEVSYTCEGRPGKAKAWTGDVEEGKTLTVEFEKKEREYQGEKVPETWIKVPRSGGNRGGGRPGQADPAKLELEREKHQDFLRKWDKDREAESERQASIAAQVCIKAAVDLACAAGDPSPSAVHGIALDLAESLRQTHEAIFDNLKARTAGGQ